MVLLLAALVLGQTSLRASREAAPPAPAPQEQASDRGQADPLAGRIGKAYADAELKDAKAGVCVLSLKSGDPVYERQTAVPLRLASNTKLLTTACALAVLGADFKFRTRVGLEKGELHVFGGGDPNISGRFHGDNPVAIFQDWATKVGAAGVKELDALVLHAGLFDDVHIHPDWVEAKYDQDDWWCAPVGALSLNDNCVDVSYEPGAKEGDPCVVTIKPDTAYVKVTNKSRSVKGSPKPFVVHRRDGTNEIAISGELQLGAKPQKTWVAIMNPTQYFGTVLKETLERAGIAVKSMREDAAPLQRYPDLKPVAEFTSDLLPTLRVCNSVSHNFYAEMIAKFLGAHVKGKGTTEAGTAVIQDWLKSIDITDVTLADGSGLSRDNRGSAASLVRLLEWLTNHKEFRAWRDSLAVPGLEGTLKRRMGDLKDAIHAKTGHINGVSCLSGYAESKSGETFAFSILVNDWKGGSPDRFQDRVCELLVKSRGD